MLKSYGVGGGGGGSGWPTAFYCQPQSPLVLDLIRTWFGLGLGGFGTNGLGTGLDNKGSRHLADRI